MLGAIAMLGREIEEDPLKTIVDKTEAKNVFVIKLDKRCKYAGMTVEDNQGEEKYLYKRETGGLPGKFITGRIGRIDLQNLKKNLKLSKTKDPVALAGIDKFKKNKIGWVKKPTILRNETALANIPEKSAVLLKLIVDEIVSKQDKIMDDLSERVERGEYGDILLTTKIGNDYLGDIEGFPKLLEIAFRGEERGMSSAGISRCCICNNQAVVDELKEPLPFFTTDKPNFIPDGIRENSAKAFPLCRNCYIDIQKGSKYIQENLQFGIPNTSGQSRLWLWLIPQLNDSSLAKEYIKKPDKGLASFKEMVEISKAMEITRDIWLEENLSEKNLSENFLTYIAVFHHYDKQKHMRLIATTDGIYPSRFRELSEQKRVLDKISSTTGNPNRFYFGLITDFLEKDNEGWMKTMTYLMSCIFTKRKIDELFITKILLTKIKTRLQKRELKEFNEITLKALVLLEYLHKMGQISEGDINTGYNGNPEDERSTKAAMFLNSHPGILHTPNLRAICAIGIAAGVIISAQRRHLKSDSFISRLNRLEMDYTRLLGLYPQMMPKLKHYEAEEYNELFWYLGSAEISNIDEKQSVTKELMNLVFAIGMASGFTIATKKEVLSK